MKLRILLSVLAFCFVADAIATDNDYTLYLVRHAEKQADGSRDPDLTAAGIQRSEQLAIWLQDKDIQKAWSSNYQRTRETAKPFIIMSGTELGIYDPGNQAILVENILHEQNNALIVGHSNTIPELARLLCHCEIDDMEESEYDRLIVVSVVEGDIQAKTMRQTRGIQP